MNKKVKLIIITTLIINIVLTIIKIFFGFLGNTQSLISDGFNSLTDILISGSLIVTIYIASKEPDKDHPYGHEKYEGIASLVLSFILLFTAVIIVITGIQDLIIYNKDNSYLKPANYTIVVAIISIILKAVIYRINMIGYKKYEQVSLKADAINHLSDIFATTASLIGIIFSIYGFIYMDYIASILIGVIIIKNAIVLFKEAISYLVDESPSKEYNQTIKDEIINTNGVLSIDEYKSRKHMNKVYIDVEIGVKYSLSLIEAHAIAEAVHLKIEEKFVDVIHCMVHVNPNAKIK